MAPWNDSEDRQLLLSVITLAQVNPNWDDVATQMGKTKEAVRYDLVNLNQVHQLTRVFSQRFAKLKKEAGDPPAAAASASTVAPAAAPTPRKRKPKLKAKKAASADDDEDEDEGTPITKRPKVKREAQDDDEEET
ncbi:hypothetical protein D6C84_02027 [Aureobasidium pullulans]|uniref:Myb-like domain-containing protein n=1 Tax=Aureobasidium pullulans TaxID=5580 RepID=A0A4S9Y4X7_AURPU|nr:hypothetical protein D6C84_02027 [Aureobasidium pullulans]